MAGGPYYHIVGCHDDRFVLKKSLAARNYLIPAASRPGFTSALRRIIKSERIDLTIPNSDREVGTFSALRKRLPCRMFLPDKKVIDLCQDKYALTTFLRRQGLPAPRTYSIRSFSEIDDLFRRFTKRERLWCRIRRGSGSFGAIPVVNPDQVRAWITYWKRMRGVAMREFILSEYLPGRDFCVELLWQNGTLILAKMAQRLVYIENGSPSGTSSTPALAKTVLEPHVLEVCTRAIRTLDPRTSGIFFLDIKENGAGEPCITEINAGRFPMITAIFDLTGKYNMAATYVRLAMNRVAEVEGPCDYEKDCYLVRSLDTLPAIFRGDELLDGIQDIRRSIGQSGR